MARKLHPKLQIYLDKVLKGNPVADNCIKAKNARGLLVEVAKACVGIKEKTGRNDGEMVELFQQTVDGKAQGEAWCMAFVQSMIAYVEYKLGIISPVFSSEHCVTTWNKTDKKHRVINRPAPGAVIIWRHGDTSSGHTGLVLADLKPSFTAVEGNASGYTVPVSETMGKVEREGNGVYFTKRAYAGNGDMKVLGFIKPF